MTWGESALRCADAELELEQLGPERADAEFRHPGEIEANVADGAPERAATDLTLAFLQRGHSEFRIVRAGSPGGASCALG